MTQPHDEDAPARRTPPPHRGLGVLGYLVGAGLLALGLVLLTTSPTVDLTLERPTDDGTDERVTVTVVCHSALSGGQDALVDELDADEVFEQTVDDQPGVLTECSRLRDQALARTIVAGVGGVLWVVVVTAALGWAALRRASRGTHTPV